MRAPSNRIPNPPRSFIECWLELEFGGDVYFIPADRQLANQAAKCRYGSQSNVSSSSIDGVVDAGISTGGSPAASRS